MWRLASRPDVAVDVASAGLACCSLEVEAASQRGLLVASETVPQAAVVTVLVVAGTVTTAVEPALVRLFDEHAQHGPVIIVSFGACATSGGPYWDAPTVRPGVEALFPGQEIASYVPGCPPRPEALVVELERLVDSRIPA